MNCFALANSAIANVHLINMLIKIYGQLEREVGGLAVAVYGGGGLVLAPGCGTDAAAGLLVGPTRCAERGGVKASATKGKSTLRIYFPSGKRKEFQ